MALELKVSTPLSFNSSRYLILPRRASVLFTSHKFPNASIRSTSGRSVDHARPRASQTDDDITAEESTSTSQAPDTAPYQPPRGYKGLALASVSSAAALFILTRAAGAGVNLGTLAADSVPYDEALYNGRPTVVEFYADWCQVCRESAKDVFSVEKEYKDRVNFVLLNIDNVKWAAELDEFGVDGIPHFSFLDREGNEEGFIVGKLPGRILRENVEALADGAPTVPHSQLVGEVSERNIQLDGGQQQQARNVEPRSHSQFS